jgi:hypothetical protein
MSVKITNHYFEFGGLKYFRENAQNVELGSYGEKKDPIGPSSHLDVENRVSRGYLVGRVKFNTRARIAWEEATAADVEAEGKVKFFGIGLEVAGDASYANAKTAKLDLVNFAIDEGPLKLMLNQDATAARDFLAKEGADGRVGSEVWVAMSGELAEHFATNASKSTTVRAVGNDLSITVAGGKYGSQTVRLSRGTTFAYKLHKVKDWNNGKTKIENMEADYQGMQ